jgi:hypothetical protein
VSSSTQSTLLFDRTFSALQAAVVVLRSGDEGLLIGILEVELARAARALPLGRVKERHLVTLLAAVMYVASGRDLPLIAERHDERSTTDRAARSFTHRS